MNGGRAHQDVERAELGNRSGNRRADEVGLAGIAMETDHLALSISRKLFGNGKRILRVANDGNIRAAVGQQRRGRKADAGAAAYDEGGPAFEFPIDRW
ncbi:hypothetical protein GCM10007874_26780 [Labrys miyagiensis]|uniref:Uncharacterized protein n=1 Tax=Labrys miyagiensis TaxID=346912 RepID=A0ABQ6CH44_9HYPH|nr:hypothetical protein GCM10007874_26780 [Labrys miyagiensis]